MKTVYLFDKNGLYLYAEQCFPSPLEPGKYIEPTDSTEIDPPSASANQVAVFASGAWSLVADHRGEVWFDQTSGDPVTIIEIGLPSASLGQSLPDHVIAENNLNAYRNSAQIALEKADLTAIRIGEAVTLGLSSWTSADVIAWTNYRRDLRISLSAAIVGTLPTKPSYPAGT